MLSPTVTMSAVPTYESSENVTGSLTTTVSSLVSALSLESLVNGSQLQANCSDVEVASPNGTSNSNCTVAMAGDDIMYSIAIVFYVLVLTVGLTGNSLVIYVVLRYSKMQTVTNMYILNLALADELFLIGIPFLIVTITVRQWMFGWIMCKLYMTSTSITQFTSSIFLTVMSADRYIAVCHPIASPRYRTPIISKVVCLTAWTLSALLMVPIFMFADILATNGSCNIVWPGSSHMNGQTAFTLYSFILSFALPILCISVFYALVVQKLSTVGPRHKSKERKKSHRKVTKLVLTVVTVYVACWLPYWVSQVVLIFTEPGKSQASSTIMIFLVTGFLSYANSAINPILYAFLSENFKKSFIKACVCAKGKDVSAQLHLENSVFPRKNRPGSEKTRTKEPESEDDANEPEASTAITMTSRSNNVPAAASDKYPMLSNCRNGYHRQADLLAPPTAADHKPTQV